jgi:hypothetical protein
VAALRAPFAIAVFLNVDCGLDNEFGLAGAVVGGVAIGLLPGARGPNQHHRSPWPFDSRA